MKNNKTISWKQAVNLLQKCSAVEWGDGFVCVPNVVVEGGGGVFEVNLSYTDEEGLGWEAGFVDEDNKEVTVSGCSMFLKNTEGDEEQLTLLAPMKLVK